MLLILSLTFFFLFSNIALFIEHFYIAWYSYFMQNYIRARSDEQKEERLNQIKEAADSLFEQMPYTEISLTTIADKLTWSRANLYKYVTTKEEIFLEISSQKMAKYFKACLAAFPKGNKYSPEVIAEVWAGILNANQDYLRYVSYLNPIIETNVTVERLATFKKKYYEFAEQFCNELSTMLSISQDTAYKLQLDILMFSAASAVNCYQNPLIKDALTKINITPPKFDFYEDIKDFVLMKIKWTIK